MTKITETCIEPYLDSFMRSFTEANYKPETIKGYRNLVRRLGLAMDEASVAPSALTPDLAEKLGRAAEPESTGTIRLYSLGRKFGAHLIEIGVAKPAVPTVAEAAAPNCWPTSKPISPNSGASVRAASTTRCALPTASWTTASVRT